MTLREALTHIETDTFRDLPTKTQKAALKLSESKTQKTLLHAAAREGLLKNIPPEHITIEALTSPDSTGQNPLHLSSLYGCLNQLPEKFLTEENLTKPNTHGNNSFHWAACGGFLSQIPKKLFTTKNLLLVNKQKESVFEYAIKYNHLDQLHQCLSQNSLKQLEKSLKSKPSLHSAAIPWIKNEIQLIRQKNFEKSLELQDHQAL